MTTADELEAHSLSIYLVGERRGCHDLVCARSAAEALQVLYDGCGYGPDEVSIADVHLLTDAECRAMTVRDEDGVVCGTVWDELRLCDAPRVLGGTEW